MKQDSKIKAYLLFDSFGNNPDPNYYYNSISDAEFPQIIGAECVASTPTPSPSPTISPSVSPSPTASVSPTSSPTATATVTTKPTVSISLTPTPTYVIVDPPSCGLADSHGDGKFNIIDFAGFAKLYGKTCEGVVVTTGCGSRDVNGDHKLNIVDFASFAKRYGKASCNL
jgi:hypothetical protein